MQNSNFARRSVGHAIQALRPYIKALELAQGHQTSRGEFRYQIADDRATACIIRNPTFNGGTAATAPVEQWLAVEGTVRPIIEWARIGKQTRLAFIGLKAAKEKHRQEGVHVQYSLNVIDGSAVVTNQGVVMTEYPSTIADWAPVGREVEQRFFESYKAAVDWKNDSAAAETLATMETLGIVRAKPTSSVKTAKTS